MTATIDTPFKEGSFRKIKFDNYFLFCKRESDVEDGYLEMFKDVFKNNGHKLQISHPHNTDGLMIHKSHGLRTLMEYKFDKDLKDKLDQVKILVQSVYYLKCFENAGDELPSVIFVGDINECFMVHTNCLLSYLDADIDWSIAPSQAAHANPELVRQMVQDDNINPWIYDVKGIDLTRVLNELKSLSNGEAAQVRITEKNVHRLFSHFRDQVISKPDKYGANTLVGMFMGMILAPNDNYLHPNKKHTLVTKDYGEVKIATNKYKAFIAHHTRDLTAREKELLTGVCDRLIEDTTRRFKGEFYTPTEWVDEAHKMISESLGEDWKDEYVVWDPACGTLNLTRDYKFKELYCSTLNQSDLDIGDKYNPEATKFQYDFLNDCDLNPDIFGETKIAPGLLEAFKQNKKIVVFMNPPYGTSSDKRKGKSKKGLAFTEIHGVMKEQSLGDSVKQLYAQFMYKILRLQERYGNEVTISLFSSPVFMTGQKFKKFRNLFLQNFEYQKGMLFQASNFADVADNWGISFTIWKSGESGQTQDFVFSTKRIDDDTGEIVSLGEKTAYHLDKKETANKWAREQTRGIPQLDAPQLSTAITVKQKGYGRLCADSLGYMWSCTSVTENNATSVGIFSSTFSGSNSNGYSIFDFNFYKTVALFIARKSVASDWINSKDEYAAPNESHPDYRQWNDDAIVYSLFNTSSNQSSMRDVDYKDKKWDIQNEWFWMSNTEMRELADEQNDEVYQDAKRFNKERFVYNKLQEVTLSPDAQEVLDMATELVKKTFAYRSEMDEDLHLNTWDAGWYQIKRILKEFFPDDLKAFTVKYKAFEDRMREGVYKFEFLKGGFESA